MKWNNSKILLNVNQELAAVLSTVPRIHTKLESFIFGKMEPVTGTTRLFSPANSLSSPTPLHFAVLRETLSSAFEDYDFSDLSINDFKRVNSYETIRTNISWQLSSSVASSEVIVGDLFEAINHEILAGSADIYRYEPQSEDVFSENGGIWNYTYFFINEKMHKVLLFHLREGADDFGSSESCDEFNDDSDLVEDRYAFGVF